MKKLHFTYNMQIEYSLEVSNCNFTIKCIPIDTLRQKTENLIIKLQPENDYQWGIDGFKNKYIWGKNIKPHYSFVFSIEGDVLTGLSEYETCADSDLDVIYGHPHGLNIAGSTIKDFYLANIQNIRANTFEKVLIITALVYDEMNYRKGSTNVNTSAEEAFSNRSGVCQDYAHILISFLHLVDIRARYVTGFIIGEGESHAWVEFMDDDKWYGIDPTNNKLVNDEYIKIGNGRDAKDCMLNRGIMHGGGAHTQVVKVNVSKVEKGRVI